MRRGCENSFHPLINLERVQCNLIIVIIMGGIKMRNAHGTWFLTCPNICHTFGGARQDTRWITGHREWEAGTMTSVGPCWNCCFALLSSICPSFSNNYPHYPDHYKPITPLGFSHSTLIVSGSSLWRSGRRGNQTLIAFLSTKWNNKFSRKMSVFNTFLRPHKLFTVWTLLLMKTTW